MVYLMVIYITAWAVCVAYSLFGAMREAYLRDKPIQTPTFLFICLCKHDIATFVAWEVETKQENKR